MDDLFSQASEPTEEEHCLTPWLPQRQRIFDGTGQHPSLQGGKSGERGFNVPNVLLPSSALFSQGSEDLITGSPELGFDTVSSVSLILGDEKSSPDIGPESRSSTTSGSSLSSLTSTPTQPSSTEAWTFEARVARNGRGAPEREIAMPLKAQSGRTGRGDSAPLVATFVKAQKAHDPEDCERWEEAEAANTLSPRDGSAPSVLVFTQNQRDELRDLGDLAASLSGEGSHQTNYLALLPGSTSSAGASPARTSPSPESDEDSPASDLDSSTSSLGSLSLFDPDGFSSRTYPDCSPHTAVGTSESFLERWPTSGTAWAGGLSTHASSECRSVEGECSSSEPSLTEILEPPQNVPDRYSLSARAAEGILRRAQKRGRLLPDHLRQALTSVASITGSKTSRTEP